jgi:hypothetical protein
MKTKFLLLILAFTLLDCRKEKPLDIEEYATKFNKPSEIHINLNGKVYPVVINGAGFYRNKIGFSLRKLIDNNINIDESGASIASIDLKIGKQIIYRSNFDSTDYNRPYGLFYTNTSDGDITADIYSVIESDSLNNFINITEEQNSFHEIRGVFSMSLVRTKKSQYTLFPNLDTVRFRNCSFYLFLK